ncbi:glutamate--cysteine ligase [bacterium]|nr:glutamate--cysteine ligase [bacterium]
MKKSFGLFERYGVELEYMIVDEETLNVRPESDKLIALESGSLAGDVARGRLEWSNELSLHLIELKTGRPAVRLSRLDTAFQTEVRHINHLLQKSGARLLPTAMHPWMDPARESRLWPHSNGEIYAAFDRIFNCSGHGWTNLQSTHINLPFRTAAEFRKLHTAIRLVLPLLPALAASSPFIEGRRAPMLDARLETYRHNCRRIPSITGHVIPDVVNSPTEYRRKILHKIYRDLTPHDPEKLLQEEWANARGAIARFERDTIEIRVLDIQECPAADLAIIQFVASVLRALTNAKISPEAAQSRPSTRVLEGLLLDVIQQTGKARVTDPTILSAFGIDSESGLEARELLELLLEAVAPAKAPWRETIELILIQGTLAERILTKTGERPSRAKLRRVYAELADCLERGKLLHA